MLKNTGVWCETCGDGFELDETRVEAKLRGDTLVYHSACWEDFEDEFPRTAKALRATAALTSG